MKRRYRTDTTAWPAITDLMTSIVVVAILVGISGYISYTNTVEALEDSLQASEGKVAELEDSLQASEGMVAELEDSLQASEGKVAELEDSLQASEGMVAELEDSLQASKNRIMKLENIIADTDEHLTDSITSLNERIDEIIRECVGPPSCLGLERKNLPNSLMTIQVRSGRIYSVQHNLDDLTDKELDSFGVNSEVRRYISTVPEVNFRRDELIDHAKKIEAIAEGKCRFFVKLENHGVSKSELQDIWYNDLQWLFSLTNPGILR